MCQRGTALKVCPIDTCQWGMGPPSGTQVNRARYTGHRCFRLPGAVQGGRLEPGRVRGRGRLCVRHPLLPLPQRPRLALQPLVRAAHRRVTRLSGVDPGDLRVVPEMDPGVGTGVDPEMDQQVDLGVDQGVDPGMHP